MSLETNDFEFGDFLLVQKEKVLLRQGKPVSLTPKAFQLLVVLLENHGHIVEKTELMNRIWADSFVEESNLAFTMRLLRVALGDESRNPQFIETVSRRGYRFIHPVEQVSAESNDNFIFQPKPAEIADAPKKSKLSVFATFAAACLIIFVSWFALGRYFDSQTDAPILSAPFRANAFSNSGKVRHAAISPDGKYVAFVDEIGDKQAIWLRKLETSENVQIVPPSDEFYHGIVFAHDGQTIFFVRTPITETPRASIYRVSSFGGVSEKILDFAEGWISISPDDRQISFVRCEYKDNDFCSLMIADVNGQNERKILTRPRPVRISDNQFSPDGKSIAFAEGNSANGGNDFRLSKLDLATGAESEISPQRFFNIKNLKWLPDGENILTTAMETLAGKAKVWQVSTATGNARMLTKDAANYVGISLDKLAERMIATQIGNNFQLHFSSGGISKALTVARETAFTPDGKIVYTTDEGDIWTIRRDGGEQRQLTNNAFNDFSAIVSPDGRFIYFTSNRTGANQVWRMNADGSDQTQVSKTEGGYPVAVSPDGKWIFYESGLRQTLRKISADGAEDVEISDRKIYRPAISPDGNLAAFFFRQRENNNKLKIGVMTLADKKLVKILELPDTQPFPVMIVWSSDNFTINYVSTGNAKNQLRSQTLDENSPRLIADLGEKEVIWFALAPDGNSFSYASGEWLYDAVLIDGLK